MGNKSNFKKKQKPFKARHATKGSIKAASKGRLAKAEGAPANNGKHTMSKMERRNYKTQMRVSKQIAFAQRTKIFDGRHGTPRNVALIPLTDDINSMKVAEIIASVLEAKEEGMGILNVEKFRQRIRLYIPKFDQFFDMMDCARSADFVLFILSAQKEISDYGEQIMRCITMQGVTTSFGLIWGVNEKFTIQQTKQSLTSWFGHFFPGERLYSLLDNSEVGIVGRLICQKTPKGVHWRDDRTYIVAERIETTGTNMIIEGSVRGQPLSPDLFMHIPGYGDYKVKCIEKIVDTDGVEPQTWRSSESFGSSDIQRLVDDQIELESEDIDKSLDGNGIRVDGHKDVTGLIEANIADQGPQIAKKVPEGTSDYQRAWFLEGEDYCSDSDDENDVLTDEEGDLVDQRGEEEQVMEEDDLLEDDYEFEDGEKMDTDKLDAIENYTKRPIDEAKDDLEFPDEIDIDPRVSAKNRFRRYRGVRSIRHTDWNPREVDIRAPKEYARLYRPGNLLATRNRILKLISDGAKIGTMVRVHLIGNSDSNTSGSDPMSALNRGSVVTAFGLLPGEEKWGYVNASFTMDSEVQQSIKSKESLIVQYGPRRMLISPLFSQGGYSDNDVYKFHRFLHPGRSCVATFIAPVILNNAPVVYYRTSFQNEQLILGSGTVQDCDANRIIVKRAILTGLPVKIHRKLVTVRHMFFSREDVEWFKAVPLYTKLGAQGFIKECLGTHGLFKATFDKKIKSEDTIAMPLYKRVWPKIASYSP